VRAAARRQAEVGIAAVFAGERRRGSEASWQAGRRSGGGE